MDRRTIIEDVERCLADDGYRVSPGSGCFDLLARKDFSIALKVLVNVDSFTRSEACDLKTISCFLETFPFLIGERANRYELEDSVVYERFGVAAMSPETFTMFVNGVMPRVKTRRGGFSVKVDAKKLETCMAEQGISVSELSSLSGLSMKTLYKCGRDGVIDKETCEGIEKVVGISINTGVKIHGVYNSVHREPVSVFKKNISLHLERLGFDFSFLSRSPFNLIIKEEEAVVSLASQDRKRLAVSAGLMQELERDFDLSPVFITTHSNLRNIGGVPALSLRELEGIGSSGEFMENVAGKRS